MVSYENINFEKLRKDVEKYLNGNKIMKNPFGVSDANGNIDTISDAGLLKLAEENGFNLEKYSKGRTRKN